MSDTKKMRIWPIALIALVVSVPSAKAATIQFGDKDVLGGGTYADPGTGIPFDPVAGATLEGLAPGVSTVADLGFAGFLHFHPFAPSITDFPGTDRMYVGSGQLDAPGGGCQAVDASHRDGYSLPGFQGNVPGAPPCDPNAVVDLRRHGPQIFSLDYSAVVPPGAWIDTLTLGIAFDDFQYPDFGEPFFTTVNGFSAPQLDALANQFTETGPRVSFATIGIDPSWLNASNILALSIDEGGKGGDGWAVDFLTIGVTTVPEPGTLSLFGAGAALLAGSMWQRRRRQVKTP